MSCNPFPSNARLQTRFLLTLSCFRVLRAKAEEPKEDKKEEKEEAAPPAEDDEDVKGDLAHLDSSNIIEGGRRTRESLYIAVEEPLSRQAEQLSGVPCRRKED